MLLEALGLEVLNTLKFSSGNIVLVHVHQDIFYHDDSELDLCPDVVDFLDEFLVCAPAESGHDGLQQLDGRVPHSVVQQLPMLVQHQVVGRAVQLLV